MPIDGQMHQMLKWGTTVVVATNLILSTLLCIGKMGLTHLHASWTARFAKLLVQSRFGDIRQDWYTPDRLPLVR